MVSAGILEAVFAFPGGFVESIAKPEGRILEAVESVSQVSEALSVKRAEFQVESVQKLPNLAVRPVYQRVNLNTNLKE